MLLSVILNPEFRKIKALIKPKSNIHYFRHLISVMDLIVTPERLQALGWVTPERLQALIVTPSWEATGVTVGDPWEATGVRVGNISG